MVNFSLKGKTALVTGASRGIGQALAVALAQSGAFVICASSKAGGCDETLNKINTSGGEGCALHADLSDPNAVTALATEALEVNGKGFFSQGLNVADVFVVKNNGHVFAQDMTIMMAPFPDYVFAKEYELMSIEQLGAYINKNKHLPNMPTAKAVDPQVTRYSTNGRNC